VYAGAHPTDQEHKSSFNVVDRICEPIKNKRYTAYMDRWFSSPTLFDHLWSLKTKAVGTVMSNQKEVQKQTSVKKLKKKKVKNSLRRDHLLAIKWQDVCDVYILSTADDDSMVDAPA
jgi:hypothetical protein